MASKSRDRACSYCHQVGHNARTCTKKKAEGGVSASAKYEDKPSSSGPAAAGSSVPPAVSSPIASSESASSSEPVGPILPVEYEGAVKVVACNGTTLRIEVREYEGTPPNYTLRVQRSTSPASEQQFDHEIACRVIELMTWAVQRQTARRGLLPRPNGSKSASAETR